MLTESDFRRDRTTRELRAWVDAYLDGRKATPSERSRLRFDKGLNKRMKEEVLPVLRMLERAMPNEDVRVSFPVDSGPYDATMRIGSTGTIIPLQVTCDFSYEEHLRLQLLDTRGIAPGFGRVQRIDGKIHAVHEAYSTDEAAAHFTKELADRINRKVQQKPAIGTWLIVQCVDEALPDSAVDAVMKGCAQAAVGSPYARAYIVGTVAGRNLCRELIAN